MVINRWFGVVALFVISFAGAARADTPTAPATPAVQTASATGDVRTAARSHYDRGISLYQAGDFKLALIEFRRAYEFVADYRVLYNIGQVSQQLAAYADATRALTRYLDEGGEAVTSERRLSVAHDLESLRLRTAHIAVGSNAVDAEIYVDGVSVARTPLATPLLVDAGERTVELRKQGYVNASRAVTLAGEDDVRIDLQMAPQAETRMVAKDAPVGTSRTTWLWIGWSGAAALAVGAAVSGVVALNAAVTRETGSPSATRSSIDDADARLRAASLVTDILGGSALALGATTLYFTLRRPAGPDLRVAPLGTGIVISGTFF
jgi:hypothetical protein